MRREDSSSGSPLAAVESTLFALVTGHGPPARPADAAALIVGDARASAGERLHVYAHMYQARLVEALEAQFPRLARHLGAEAFAAVVAGYVAEHPSRHPSLRYLGQRLPAWLARRETASGLADLARLEWARADVFDDADALALTMDAMRVLPPDAFATLALRLVPAHRLITVDGGAVSLWDDDGPADFASQGPTAVLVWRQDVVVYHRTVDGAEGAALSRVASGCTFGTLCEALAETQPPEVSIQQAFAWLSTWISDGLLVGESAASATSRGAS